MRRVHATFVLVSLALGACSNASPADSSGTNRSEATSANEPDEAGDSSTEGPSETESESETGDEGLDPCSPEAALEVVTFNIRFDDGFGSMIAENGWLNLENPRREMVVALTEDMDPDLMGVQEALVNQVVNLKGDLPAYGFVGVGRDDGDQAGEYAGIFYKRDRLELLDEGHFWLSETPDVPGTVFEGSGSTRMATWVVVRDRLTLRELFVINTHWDNASQASREQSAALMRSMLGPLASERPIVFTGDLNVAESNPALQALLADDPEGSPAMIDGYRQVVPVAEADEATFHGFGGNPTGSRIDYVLHDANFATTAAAIRRDSFEGKYPSDHFPVSGTLEWTHDADGMACP